MLRTFQLIDFFIRLINIRLFHRANREIESRREIYYTFSYLGGVYIKFLQMIILNGEFLRGWGGPAELSIFESLPYEPLDPKKIIRDELGAAKLARFKSIKPKPFATGSFAQVYEATLTDDSHVIVKILRPRLIKTLKKDLRTLTFLVRVMSIFRATGLVDVKLLFGNFVAMTWAEVDYKAEVKKAKWFWKYYKDNEVVVVPWTYEELSSKSIITQEYIDGISLAELMADDTRGKDPVAICQEQLGSNFWYLMEVLGEEFVHATLWSEYMFGDPHPGNLKIMPGNRIGIIDFGLVAETSQNKVAYLDLLEAYKDLYEDNFDAAHFTTAFINFFDETLAKSLRQVEEHVAKKPGAMLGRIGESAARNFMTHIGQGVGADAIDRKRIAEVFFNAVNDGNRYGLKMDPQTASMMKAAGSYMFMIREFSHNKEEELIMSRVLKREVDYAKANLGRLPQSRPGPNVSLEEAVEILGDWLTQVADRDPRLYYNLSRSLDNGYA